MNKSGIVLQTNNKIACLMTSDGSFVKVKIKGSSMPQEGQIYSGEMYKSIPNFKLPLIAAMTSFFVFLGGGMYTYYTPAAELTIDMNPSVKLTLNRWNRIIKSTSLNSDGEIILSSIKLSNKKVDDGLELIVNQAITDNFINDEYKENGSFISVHITENKNQNIDLTEFEKSIKTQDLNIEVVHEKKSISAHKKNSISSEDIKSTPSGEYKPAEENKESIEENNKNVEEKKEIKQDEKEIKQDEQEIKQDEKKAEQENKQSENENKQDKNQSNKATTGNTKKSNDITENKSVSKEAKKNSNSSLYSKLRQIRGNTKK